jgi:uncharacterized DUF497 family protein
LRLFARETLDSKSGGGYTGNVDIGYTRIMSANITFNSAAFKHGVTEADIRRAIDVYIYEDPLEDYENKYLLLGYDTNGRLLEIMYNIIEGENINVFHAMPCRRAFYTLVGGKHGKYDR